MPSPSLSPSILPPHKLMSFLQNAEFSYLEFFYVYLGNFCFLFFFSKIPEFYVHYYNTELS